MNKRVILFAFLCVVCATLRAQFTPHNSLVRRAIVEYYQDGSGLWCANTDVLVGKVGAVESCYALDKKQRLLYVRTATGNYCISLDEEAAKQWRKQKKAPVVATKDIPAMVGRQSDTLRIRYASLNEIRQRELDEQRRKYVADSIAREERRRAREAELQRQREQAERRLVEYRRTHSWREVPCPVRVSCALSGCSYSTDDTLYVSKLQGDTLMAYSMVEGKLDKHYVKVHAIPVTARMRADSAFAYHLEAFADSLSANTLTFDDEVCDMLNAELYLRYLDELRKAAPYGFFDRWTWDDEYNMISFSFTYTNTNRRTIRYIDVYWTVRNDVGDVRGSGHFAGTGPVEEFESGTWEWDSSSYFVAGDASRMSLTKVIITYMDGTKRTLTGGNIVEN